MANKKKESEFKHDYNVMLRLTEEEYEVLKEDALQAKMSVAVFARSVVMQRNVTINFKVVADMEDVRSIGRELYAIGNNLNQIAQYFHTGGTRSEYILQEINRGVKDLEIIRKDIEKLAGDGNGSD